MSSNRKTAPDHDNPEWTKEDFRKSVKVARGSSLGEAAKAAVQHRGAQKAPRKVAVYIRLSPDVVDHFKAAGPGWQTRIDDTLKSVVFRTAKRSPAARPSHKRLVGKK